MSAVKNNPFPGLRPFGFEERDLFFGREKHVQDLLQKLVQHHFVAIVGASGSGKSSLIRAGLLPAVHSGLLGEGQDDWHIATMKPGTSPLLNLKEAIESSGLYDLKVDNPEKRGLDVLMRQSPLGLVQGLRHILTDNRKILLLVDQFEELFRYKDKEDESFSARAKAFVDVLVATVKQKDVPIYIVLTLRSDFLGDCVLFEGLPEAINDGHYLVPRLTKKETRAVIIKPVEYANGKISPRLVQTLLNDLNDDLDQLPVLQHALSRCWKHWIETAETGEPMDVDHYQAIGGMNNALSLHADEAFDELRSDKSKELIKRIFKTLTVKTSGDRGVRRPTTLFNLAQITESSIDEVVEALKPFRKHERSFILPTLEVELAEDTVIDISHESLMRGWHRLVEWVEEETESAEIYSRLTESAILHERGQSGYYRDPELQIASDWFENNRPNPNWAEQYNSGFDEAITFLHKSMEFDLEEKRRKGKRRRTIQIAVLTFLVIVSALSVWAMFQTNLARKSSDLAEARAIEALEQKQAAEKASNQALEAKSIAEEQSQIALDNKKLAEEQSVLATQQAEKAAYQALVAQRKGQEAIAQRQIAEEQRLNAEQQKTLAEQLAAEANRQRMISIGNNLALRCTSEEMDKDLRASLAHHAYGMITENNGELFNPVLFSAVSASYLGLTERPELLRKCRSTVIAQATLSEITTSYLLSDGSFWEFDAETNKHHLIDSIGEGKISSAYIVGEKQLVVGLENTRVLVYEIQPVFRKLYSFDGHKKLLRAADLSPNSGLLATGGRDSVVFVTGEKFKRAVRLESRVRQVLFDNKDNVLIGLENGKVFHFAPYTEELKEIFAVPNTRCNSIVRSKGGKLYAFGFSDGTVGLFDAEMKQTGTIKMFGSADQLLLSEERKTLTSVSGLRIVNIHDLTDLNKLPIVMGFGANILAMTTNLKGDLVLAFRDKSIRLYNSDLHRVHEKLVKQIDHELTEEQWKLFVGNDVPYLKYVLSSTDSNE